MSEVNKVDYSKYFVVDPESPTGLRWRDDLEVSTGNRRRNAQAGKPAGVCRKIKGRTDQVVVLIEGKIHITSRVIYTLIHGEIPDGYIIDHLDGNGFNNKIENLALKTRGENMRNRKVNKNNPLGIPGVTFVQSGKKTYCIGTYRNHKKQSVKRSFCVQEYGLLPAMKEAVLFRKEGMQAMNEKYDLKFTERHLLGSI